MTEDYKSILEELDEESLENNELLRSIIESLEDSIETKDQDLKRSDDLLNSREADFYRRLRSETCINCEENIKQYKNIRTAFDRRKDQMQRISKFLTDNTLTYKGKRLSLNQLIKLGQE
tara:strand:+ start:1290 stop:1646 length:357 start_codon:yes stop_codon:yes gene_type:complete